MRGRGWLSVGILAIAAGCHSGPTARSVSSTEPGLATPTQPGGTVVESQPPQTVTWADRHPLFTKPREYYNTSGNNKVVKAAAATVIGIPAGIYGELKQIVVGAPPDSRF